MVCINCDYCCHTLEYEVYTDEGFIKPHKCQDEEDDLEEQLRQWGL